MMGWPGLPVCDFGKEVKVWGAGLELRRRDKSSLDRPWGGPAVVMKLDSSELSVEVESKDRGW